MADAWSAFDAAPAAAPAAERAQPTGVPTIATKTQAPDAWAAFDAPAATSPEAPTPTQTTGGSIVQGAVNAVTLGGLGNSLPPDVGEKIAQGVGDAVSAASTVQGLRDSIAPTPGYVSSGVLPIATKEVSPGQGALSAGWKFDLGPVRSVLNPILDLMEGTGLATSAGGANAPLAGKVSPEATAFLGSMALGNPLASRAEIMRPPFAGPALRPTGAPAETPAPEAAIPPPEAAPAAPAGPPAPPYVPPGTPAPVLPRILELLRADDQVAANRPDFIPPDAAQPKNPLPQQPRTVQSAVPNPNGLLSLADPGAAPPPNGLMPPAVAKPASAGAAASRDLTDPSMLAMDPREAAASQATAENYRLAQGRVEGMDKTEYVKGVVPTAAEVSGDADVAAHQKYVLQTPGEAEATRKQVTANNEARIDHFDDLAGTPTIVNRMKEVRGAQRDADLAAAWQNKSPVDAQPVVDQIDAVLAGPQGKLSAVKTNLTKVRDLLYNADGMLETDPEVVYGARREVATMLGKAAQQEKPTLKDAAAQLGDVRTALDQTIEKGAPGYQQYLKNYAEASKPIDMRELLLDARPGLLGGADRMMNFQRIDRLMRDIVSDRQAAGANPAKSIDEATMEGLWNLHSDLKRATNIDLGKPRGSDTSMLSRMGDAAGTAVAAKVANTVLPVIGPIMVLKGREMMQGRAMAKQAEIYRNGPAFKMPKRSAAPAPQTNGLLPPP